LRACADLQDRVPNITLLLVGADFLGTQKPRAAICNAGAPTGRTSEPVAFLDGPRVTALASAVVDPVCERLAHQLGEMQAAVDVPVPVSDAQRARLLRFSWPAEARTPCLCPRERPNARNTHKCGGNTAPNVACNYRCRCVRHALNFVQP